MRYLLFIGAVLLGSLDPAHGAISHHDRRLVRCMAYLPAMHDARLRRWCLKQSERMP